MALDNRGQLQELIKASSRILVLAKESPDGDAISASCALALYLTKKEKEVQLAFSDPYKNKERFSFLPAPENVSDGVVGARDFVLIFNTEKNPIADIKTERDEKEVRIFLTPERGSIDPRDFSFVPARSKFDAVFVVGCPDKESLGKIFEENADILYEVPLVNIDHRSSNDHFAQTNIVETTASGTSEVVARILTETDAEAVDENIAQCLLAGIIAATDSFQRKNTTPRALQMAARLIELGADQQVIVTHLYKTQPLHILKLWGRVMAKLSWSENLAVVWAKVSLEDFVHSRATPADLGAVLKKITDNYSLAKTAVLLYQEDNDGISAAIWSSDARVNEDLPRVFSGASRGDFSVLRIGEENMDKAEVEVLEHIQKAQEQ